VYGIAGAVDNCNFSRTTIWDGRIDEGETFRYSQGKLGHQYICDGTDLRLISNESYDFVLSSHSLEHVANPLKALYEWRRVLKKGGVLLICLPEKHRSFDHRRPVTEFSHLVKDYEMNVGEDDLSHLSEILELHDLLMDRAAGTFSDFSARSAKNLENRCLHHHVFTLDLAVKMVEHVGFRVLMATNYLILLCEKTDTHVGQTG
jgi:SAM-dependent methyltransferase